MQVKEDLIEHPLFQALKRGKRYNSKRNRYFGVLPTSERNWEFTCAWLHPETGAIITRDDFSRQVKEPVMRAQLSQFPKEIARFRTAWANASIGL